MLIYLPSIAILLTYFIFQSKGIDYRTVAIGSLLPFIVDVFIGHASLGHSFLFSVIVLTAIMLGTISRPRLLRRRLLCISIGMFFALVLSGAFLYEQMWWWPMSHKSSGEELSITPSLTVWIIRDIIGLIALYIIVGIGELYKKEKRKEFFSTGRLS